MKNFADRVIKGIYDSMSYLCVGLDPQLRYFPPHILQYCAKTYGPGFKAVAEAIIMFNKAIIDVTNEFTFAFKPNFAFYSKYGHEGVRAFEETIRYALLTGNIVIEDVKEEDGGDTAQAYADGFLGKVDVIGEDGTLQLVPNCYQGDAVTITPWIEEPNFRPFFETAIAEGRGVIVVTRTSFKPSSSLQESIGEDGDKGWIRLAKKIAEMGKAAIGDNGYSSFGVVMGATYPEDAPKMKEVLPMAFKLVPGFGFGQGGKPDDAVLCVNDDGFGIIPNNSRGTNYAWHPDFKSEFKCDPRSYALAAAKASQQARDALNDAVYRKIGKLPW